MKTKSFELSMPSSFPIPQDSFLDTCGNCLRAVVKGGCALVTDTDGLSKISSLAVTIFELLEKTLSQIPESVSQLINSCKCFGNVATLGSLFSRIKDWSCRDNDDEFLWEKTWQTIASTICLTVSNILNVISYLEATKFITLSKKLVSYISTASNVFLIGTCGFEILNSAKKIHEFAINKAFAFRNEWQEMVDAAKGFTDDQFTSVWRLFFEKKILSLKKDDSEETQEKIQRWGVLANCDNLKGMKSYCIAKLEKWSATYENNELDRKKHWISIALNVSWIALTVIGMVLPVTTGVLMVAIAALTIATNILDITNFLLNFFVKGTDVKEVKMPELSDRQKHLANIGIIGHIDHGKTPITPGLFARIMSD